MSEFEDKAPTLATFARLMRHAERAEQIASGPPSLKADSTLAALEKRGKALTDTFVAAGLVPMDALAEPKITKSQRRRKKASDGA